MKGKNKVQVDHDHDAKAVASNKPQGSGQEFIPDHRPESRAQHHLQMMIDRSSAMVSQRKFLETLNGVTQRVPEEEEEELLQGTFSSQRQPEEEEELVQGKWAHPVSQRQQDWEGEMVQRQAARSEDDNKTGIPDSVKHQMESLHQTDFSHVRVHQDSSQAPAVGALAYTQGSDIHFAPGQFRPDTNAGRHLLGHELTHVVQQQQGRVKPTTEVEGMPVNDDPSLEQEADKFGERA